MKPPGGAQSFRKPPADNGQMEDAPTLTPMRWKPHLDFYRDKRALTFKEETELDAAIDLLWSEPLQDLPHDLMGGDTIIVPAEAVGYFKEKGLRFRSSKIQSAGDLPSDEVNRLRREQGPY